MSTEVGSAVVTLLPSMRGFSAAAQAELGKSGLDRTVANVATRGAASAGAKAGGLFSRAFARVQARAGSGIYVAGLLRNLRTYGYALAGVTSLTVGLGLKTASAFEQARIAFATILGSARKARALFGSLVQFAKVTPFDVPGIVTASQQLLAYGFRAKQVLPILRSLGDASAGLSLGTDGLQRVVQAIGQIQAKGRLQSQELLQLTENGIPALTILANKFGVTQAALLNLVQKGLVPANKAIPALLSGLETGTKGVAGATAKFGGLMRKQSKTLGGIFSNLKDSISIGLARAVQPLVPVLKQALPHAAAALSRAMRQAGRDLGEFLHGLGVAKDRSKGTVTGFEQFGSAVRTAAHWLAVAGRFAAKHAGTFARLGVALFAAVAASKLLAVAMIAVNAAMDANPAGAIVLAVEALAGAFVFAWTKSEKFRDIVKGVFHVLERVAGEWVTINVEAFKFVFDAMTRFAGGIIHVAAKAFGWVPGIGPKLKGAAKAFDAFGSHVDGLLSTVADHASGWGAKAGSNWNTAFMNAAGFGTGKNSPFRDPGHPGYLGPVKHAKKAGTDAGSAIGSGIGDGISSGLDKSAGKVAQSTQSLVSKILGPLTAMRAKAQQLVSSIVQSISGDTGFGALLSQTDSLGAAFGLSIGGILGELTGQKRAVAKFRNELRTLEKRGLSDSAAQEIAGEGLAQGGAFAQTLMGATRRQLREISALRSETNKAAHGIGVDFARDKYGSRIVRELARTHRAVENAAKSTSLSDKTVRRLEKAYKDAAKSVQPYVKPSELDHRHGQKVRQHS